MATVYVTYTCVSYGDSDVEIDSFELACTQGASLTTKSHAPSSLDGYTLKKCSPTSISRVKGGETVTAYYEAFEDIELELYDWDTDEYLGSDSIDDCYVDGTVTISSYAPDIDGYEFYKASPSKVTVEFGSNEATCYYRKTEATLTMKHYKDNVLVSNDTVTKTVKIGNSFTPAHDSWVIDYPGYTFQYAEGDGKKYYAGSTSTYTISGDVTFKYYYTTNTVSGTIYWRDRCNGNSSLGSYPVASARLDSTMNLTSSTYGYPNTGSKYIVARITDDNGEEYSPTEAAKFKPYANFKVYIDYEDVTKASWSCTPGFTSLEWSVTLPLAFTPSNYDLIEIVGSSTSSLKDINPSSSNGKTITIGLGVDGDSQKLTPGTPYTIGCRVTVPYGNQYYIGGGKGSFTTAKADDEDLVAGCTARWYNYAAGNTGSWSKNTPEIVISMGDYPFSSKYFMEAGMCYTASGDFTKPNTNRPSYVKDNNDSPTDTGVDSVRLSYTDTTLGAGGRLQFTAFLRTINGTYMPIPAVSPINSNNDYEFYVITKPNNVAYTTGYVPKKDEVVNIKASDINTFIHVLDLTNAWFTDVEGAGISEVEAGQPIAAVTYGGDDTTDGFYEKLNDYKGYKNFTMSFQDVKPTDPISASNMNALPISINNMLGVL